MSDLPRGSSGISIVPFSAFADVRRALLDHYDAVQRDLPWRGETDPYRIWVSEVMLQQTRVETVIPYYRRWVGLFPDVEALADATRDAVLLAWQGLGYYRRATNLHQGARVVRERFEGRVPDTLEALLELPGIGEYTGGAIASIAFGQPVPAVDGNAKRVLSRMFDEPTPGAAWLRETARVLVAPERPGDWNQALMELGATVCTPRSPSCGRCPWSRWCAARAAGTQLERPAPPKRKGARSQRFASAVVIDSGGRVLLVRRPEGGLLAGLWAFPEAAAGDNAVEAARGAAGAAGAAVEADSTAFGGPCQLRDIRHRFTHIDATYVPVLLAGTGVNAEDRRWTTLDRRQGLALPAAQEKIAKAAEQALASGSILSSTNPTTR